MPVAVVTKRRKMKRRDIGVGQVEDEVKGEQRPRTLQCSHYLCLSLIILTTWLGVETTTLADYAWAQSSASQQAAKPKGNILRGRDIFNGKGLCYYCHGVDGYLNRPARLDANTAALVSKLSPPPSDLRNPDALRLKNNQERTRAIREGHPGTGMFPDTTLTDQDLADTLLYLALIRKDPHPEQ